MTTARLAPPSSRRSLEKQSSLEQSAKESASVKPICASSIRISSVSLVTGCCDPMQQTGGSGRGSLLNEYATATSSITSQACITSGRVMGTRTETDSPPSTSDASSIILRSSGGIASAGSASAPSPTARWMYPTPALTTRSERSGVQTVCPASLGWEGPAGYSTATGSTAKGVEAYSENMATMVLSTCFPLVRSVHVHSMKTFCVSGEMRECSPLMIGGSERTRSCES
mmetsp:Transcript_15474/g.49689  ORF Transcript_15474/g.49689 Transcript_15474/m.49689 type:complete len:228 (-) Transcript_15474:687-1370(-)